MRIGRPRPVTIRPAAWTALLALLGGLILTHGLWGAPGSREIVGNPHDTDLMTSSLQHAAYSIVHGKNPFYFATLRAPIGVNAMWNTTLILPGVLLTPVTLLAGPLTSYNLLLLGSFTGTAAGLHVLLRRFVERDAAAAFGALLWTFSPPVLAGEIGHANLACTLFVPLILLAVDDLVRGTRPILGTSAWLALLLTAQLLTGEELLFQTGIFVALVLAVLAVLALRRRIFMRPLLLRVTAGSGLTLAAFVALAGYPLWVQFLGPLAEHGTPFLPDYYVTDLKGFVTPSDRFVIATHSDAAFARAYVGGAPEYLGYLGIPLIIAAVVATVGLRRRPLAVALGLAALLLAVASLGAKLLVDRDYTDIALPWSLVKHLPVVESALANRFALFVALAVAGLVALGTDAVLAGERSVVGVGVAAAAVIVVTLLPTPYAVTATAPIPGFFSHVTALLPRGTTALVLPYADAEHTEAMRWQAASDMAFAMPGGYFIGPDKTGEAYSGGGDPLTPTVKLLKGVEETGSVPGIGGAESAQLTADLRGWGATAIIVGPSSQRSATILAVTNLTGRSPVYDGDVAVWRFPAGP